MPLSPSAQGEVFTSALGSIRADGVVADLRAIAAALSDRLGQTSPADRLAVYNLVAAADRTWRMGQGVADSMNTLPRRGDIPIDPTITPGSGLILYRIVVVSSDGASNLVLITSTTPISGAEAAARAEELVRSGAVARTTNPRKYGTGAGVTYTGHVITVGMAR